MGFRFNRRVKIAPGCYLNLGKTGSSFSFGGRGFSINTGKRDSYINASLPGTGLSYRQRLGGASSARRKKNSRSSSSSQSPGASLSPRPKVSLDQKFTTVAFIANNDLASLTSPSLTRLRKAILDALTQASENAKRSVSLRGQILRKRTLLVLSFVDFSGKWRSRVRRELTTLKTDLEKISSKCSSDALLRVQFNLDSSREALFQQLASVFQQKVVGRTLLAVGNVAVGERCKRIAAGMGKAGFIDPSLSVPAFELCNGRRLYLFPRFIMIASGDDFAPIDYRDARVALGEVEYIIEESYERSPSGEVLYVVVARNDVQKIARSGDLRISLPSVHLTSAQGLDEEFLFDDLAVRNDFFNALSAFQRVW